MGLLTTLFAPRPTIGASYSQTDDFWFRPIGFSRTTESGMRVSPELAMKISAVYRCVNLISGQIGALPLHLYRKLDNGGRDRATTHPLYNVLRYQPNVRQTALEWRAMGMAYLLLRGNFYNRIVFDGRGAVKELIPLHPDRVVCKLDPDTGQRTYVFYPLRNPSFALTQDEVLHVMGLSLNDGMTGVSVLEYAAEAVGSAAAQQGYSSRFWAQGAEPGLIFVASGPMKKETREANEAALQARVGGWQNAHKALLLEGGVDAKRVGLTAREAQFIDGRKFSVSDIARFFGVPPHLVGDVDGSTSWGTGIAEQTLGFLKFTLMWWLETFTAAIYRDLIDDVDLYAEFLTDALERMDAEKRSEIYSREVGGPTMTVNEARIQENREPVPGGDELLAPVNMDKGGDPKGPRIPPTRPAPPSPPDDGEEDDTGARAWKIAYASATGLVHKETAWIRKWAPRHASDSAAWRKAVTEFYGAYVADLQERLALSQSTARTYCAARCAVLLEQGVAVAETWEREQPARLAEIALEGVTA